MSAVLTPSRSSVTVNIERGSRSILEEVHWRRKIVVLHTASGSLMYYTIGRDNLHYTTVCWLEKIIHKTKLPA